ncbi:MAG: hypothetical protein A2Z88_02265 [Omnitrophica WOR_2 bacterium GWA2_47_8]|nr:MAG: hypothetical protein A2Z88_02265 [Omnitrophica WOR_2 bacterium GWA2_47_8]
MRKNEREVGHMKRTILLAFAFIFVMSFTAPAYADHDPVAKLKGGVMSIVNVPYNIGKTTLDEFHASTFKPFGLLGGFLKGTGYGIKDMVTGLVDIVTFPIDLKR